MRKKEKIQVVMILLVPDDIKGIFKVILTLDLPLVLIILTHLPF